VQRPRQGKAVADAVGTACLGGEVAKALEVDDEETATLVEAQGGHLPSIWAPFVLIGA
jgi:hypothetical protein